MPRKFKSQFKSLTEIRKAHAAEIRKVKSRQRKTIKAVKRAQKAERYFDKHGTWPRWYK